MLILPPGHAQTVAAPYRLRTREKWMLGSVLAVTAALILVVVISIATAGHKSGNGCVEVTIPYSTGGQELYRCGAQARAMCSAVGSRRGFTGTLGDAVAIECRKARLPVG